MRKRIFTLLMSILAFGLVNAQTVIFDPATWTGDLEPGMEIVDIDGTKYLQVVVVEWESILDIPVVSNIMGTHFSAEVGFGQLTPTVDKVMGIQCMDTINLMDNWDASALVPSVTPLTQDPGVDGFKFLKGGIHDNMQFVHQLQFFGQVKDGSWPASTGDTIWCGRITSVDQSVLFDPAAVDVTTLPDGMEVVEESGEKYLKVTVDEWNTALPIAPFETGKNNKVHYKMKYDAGTSGLAAANARSLVNFKNDAADLFTADMNPSTTDFTIDTADAKSEVTVNTLQFAVQETSGDWPAQVGAVIYLGKVTVSFAEAQMAEAPNTTEVAYTTETITIDGLYDDAYGEVANVTNRIALNETGTETIPETQSYGEWLAVGDLDNFYFYIEVNDNNPIDLGASTSPWMNDGIEIFMDIQNRRYLGGSRIVTDQHQVRFNLGTDSPLTGDVDGVTNQGLPGFFGDSDTTNIEYAIVKGSNGYVIEARVPWATWFRSSTNTNEEAVALVDGGLSEGMKVAFEVSIIDADVLDGRKSILNWANDSGEDKAYLTNEFWGEVTLKGGWPVGIFEQAQKRTELSVYPNPANNQITIVMDDLANVQIFNVLGAMVNNTNLSGNNTVNISDLNQGVYIIKATDDKGNVAVTRLSKK